jgi:hypothetical protein
MITAARAECRVTPRDGDREGLHVPATRRHEWLNHAVTHPPRRVTGAHRPTATLFRGGVGVSVTGECDYANSVSKCASVRGGRSR